jgi:CRP-like cAMP-binding protein
MATPYLRHRADLKDTVMHKLGVGSELYDCFTDQFQADTTEVHFRKGDYLQRAGERASDLYWIASGIVRRGYFSADGVDVTLGFMCDGDDTGSYADLQAGGNGQPAREFFIAESAVVGYRIHWPLLQQRKTALKCVHGYVQKLMDASLRRYARNQRILVLPSAAERLQAFREAYPRLEPAISQRALASFLGISAQYMSQLKREQ